MVTDHFEEIEAMCRTGYGRHVPQLVTYGIRTTGVAHVNVTSSQAFLGYERPVLGSRRVGRGDRR